MAALSSLQIASNSDNTIETDIDYHDIKKASLILRSLNHKLRQQIIKLIGDSSKLTVTEIYIKLRLEQSVVSQHLAILRRSNIVTTNREGKFIYYRVNTQKIQSINQFVKSLLNKN